MVFCNLQIFISVVPIPNELGARMERKEGGKKGGREEGKEGRSESKKA